MRSRRNVGCPALAVLGIALIFGSVAPAQGGGSKSAQETFERLRVKTLETAGRRHLDLGSWARDRGLVAQATAQFLRASEVAAGTSSAPDRVLALMRQLDDRFWAKQSRRPPVRSIRLFEKRAAILEAKNRADWFKLASTAHQRKLHGLARIYFAKVLESIDTPIEVTESGSVELPKIGTVPKEVVDVLLDIAPSTMSGEGVRTGGTFEGPMPVVGMQRDFKAVFEARSERLVVQTDVSQEGADATFALLTAFLPILEEATGQRPTRAMRTFVFAERRTFNAWLRSRGYRETKADGVCDYGSFVTGICAEEHKAHEVQALALHETAHLYDFALSPVVFPSWYVEAWAESFGAVGTFTWDADDKQLTIGNPLPKSRLETLQAEGALLPLRDMLRTDGMKLLQTDPEAAQRFYAQSLAFLRYLREHAGEKIAARLELWENRCRGGALGAKPGVYLHRSQESTQTLFLELFQDDFETLEAGFTKWLRGS